MIPKERANRITDKIMEWLEQMANDIMPDKVEMELLPSQGYVILRNFYDEMPDGRILPAGYSPLSQLEYRPESAVLYPTSQEVVDKKIHSWVVNNHKLYSELRVIVRPEHGTIEMGTPEYIHVKPEDNIEKHPEIGLLVIFE